eukprot:1157880-Pelagomonas_calceolata.AAC.8
MFQPHGFVTSRRIPGYSTPVKPECVYACIQGAPPEEPMNEPPSLGNLTQSAPAEDAATEAPEKKKKSKGELKRFRLDAKLEIQA